MSTPDRYRTATLFVSVSGAFAQTTTCTDCGTLVLDQNTHDTWHTIQTATHLRDGDVLVLTVNPADATPGSYLDRLTEILDRHGLTNRYLVIGADLNPQVLPRPAATCPDCHHPTTDHTRNSGCLIPLDTGTVCGCPYYQPPTP